MTDHEDLRQIGRTGPWKPAFQLSVVMLIVTLSVIYFNESQKGLMICQSLGPSAAVYPIAVSAVGATVGHFILQISGFFSKWGTNKHSSSTYMILWMTGIQASCQVAMVSNIIKNFGCEDYFGVRTSMFLWVEWMTTVPIMFYLTTIMDVNKLQLTNEDTIVIFTSTFGLFCLYILNFGTVSPTMAILLMIMANLFMCGALFWLHGTSYYEHQAALMKLRGSINETDPMSQLCVEVKRRKLICAGFMNFFFTLFPVAYFLRCIDIIDHDIFYLSFVFLNFMCKGIFATLLTDSHSELLDPKTFLLFSEKQRMEVKRKTFMRYIFNEVRVPLKSVLLGLQILDESQAINSTDRETVNMVGDSSHLIQATLNDVLSIKKIEEGTLKLTIAPLRIKDLIRSVKDTFKRKVALKGIDISYAISQDVPPEVDMDETRVEQVLSRLVNNAIKYSQPNGRILLTVSVNTKMKGFVTFSVKDFGKGISEKIQSQLFIGVSELLSQDGYIYMDTYIHVFVYIHIYIYRDIRKDSESVIYRGLRTAFSGKRTGGLIRHRPGGVL